MGPPEQCKIVGYSIDEEVKSTCACGKTGIKYLFNVENAYGDVYILGSSCQNTVWSRNRPLRGISGMKAMVKILRKQRPCAFLTVLPAEKPSHQNSKRQSKRTGKILEVTDHLVTIFD